MLNGVSAYVPRAASGLAVKLTARTVPSLLTIERSENDSGEKEKKMIRILAEHIRN